MPSPCRIKICGLTRAEDIALAAALHVDALGFNFVGGPRQLSRETAAILLGQVPAPVLPVALAAGRPHLLAGALSLVEILADARLTRLTAFQCYGGLPALREEGRRGTNCWQVVTVADRGSLSHLVAQLDLTHCRPAAVLLDTADKGQLGGTGQTFNWHWIAEARAAGELAALPPLILAGGLTPDNVAEAVGIAQPDWVDVSSGVEFPGRPGVKDPSRVKAFVQAVRSVGRP